MLMAAVMTGHFLARSVMVDGVETVAADSENDFAGGPAELSKPLTHRLERFDESRVGRGIGRESRALNK